MIKKGLLFSLVVFASLFVLTACPKKKADKAGIKVEESYVKCDFTSLQETGFVPPVIRLENTYVNDKIESKAKTLSYEYGYLRLDDDKEFKDKDVDKDAVFKDGYTFHTATIKEEDAGDASKTKLKYDKLKARNGGEICIGTRFILGLKVKNQVGEEIYRARVLYTVMAPRAGAEGGSSLIKVPGDQTAFPKDSVSFETGSLNDIKFENGKTVYTLNGGKGHNSVMYGDFGKTNAVIVQ